MIIKNKQFNRILESVSNLRRIRYSNEESVKLFKELSRTSVKEKMNPQLIQWNKIGMRTKFRST